MEVSGPGNAATPASHALTTVHIGPYDRMKPAHNAIHSYAHAHEHRLTGLSWEVYGHWTDDPNQLGTAIFHQILPQ